MAASNLKVPRVDVDDLSIDSRIKNVAKKAGYASSWSLFCTSEKELQEKTKLSGVDIRVLTAAVAEANLPKQRTCLELNQDGEIPPFYISTGCPKLDHFLGGGIPFNGITEIVGESGTGKTQLSLQLALHVQLPKNYGGLGKAVAYICTESQFPIVRLQQMICHMNQKYSLVHKNYEDNIFIYSKYDMDNLVDCVQYQLPLLVSKQDVGLVVIDSVAAVFRSEEGTDINRSQNIQKLGYQLHQLASRNNIAVVAVNQVAAAMGSKHLYGVDCRITPALGLSWANLVNIRLMISRTESFITPYQCTSEVKYYIRMLNVMFCPWLARKSISFVVTHNGVEDVDGR